MGKQMATAFKRVITVDVHHSRTATLSTDRFWREPMNQEPVIEFPKESSADRDLLSVKSIWPRNWHVTTCSLQQCPIRVLVQAPNFQILPYYFFSKITTILHNLLRLAVCYILPMAKASASKGSAGRGDKKKHASKSFKVCKHDFSKSITRLFIIWLQFVKLQSIKK